MWPFKLERTDETLTAHGGLALLAECNHGLGVCGLTDRYLPGPGSHRGYAPAVCGDRRILMRQAGGRRLEDLRAVRRDAGLRRRLDRAVRPDPATRGDGRRRRGDPPTGPAGLVGLGPVRDGLPARLRRRDGHEPDPLDVEATRIAGEQRDAPWSDQGVRGSMPRRGLLFEPSRCLVDACRDGKVSPGAGHRAFYRACTARLPVGKRLARYRADRASSQAERINTLATEQLRGAITADQDVAVKAVLAGVPTEAWQEPEPGGGDQVAEAVHPMNQTKAACRLSLTRAARPQPDLCAAAATPYADHVVASHGPAEEQPAQEGLGWHHHRGQAENVHQELNTGFGMDQLPCGEAGAPAVFFRIGVRAYNLFIGCNRVACPAAGASQTLATGRGRRVQGAGRLLRHAGRVVLRLVLAADALACGHTIRQRGGALALAT